LEEPVGAPALRSMARGRRDAVVVISDITRPVPNPRILPPLLATLEEAGIRREAISILIATGMHRPNEGEELLRLGHTQQSTASAQGAPSSAPGGMRTLS